MERKHSFYSSLISKTLNFAYSSPKAPLYNLVGHTDKILAVDWSVASLLMSGGADNQLRIFQYADVSGGKS